MVAALISYHGVKHNIHNGINSFEYVNYRFSLLNSCMWKVLNLLPHLISTFKLLLGFMLKWKKELNIKLRSKNHE